MYATQIHYYRTSINAHFDGPLIEDTMKVEGAGKGENEDERVNTTLHLPIGTAPTPPITASMSSMFCTGRKSKFALFNPLPAAYLPV